jgi:hypothetical protein
LRLALSEYVARGVHQGKDNVRLFPHDTQTRRGGPVQCRERLRGLLRYYHQEAASDDPVAGDPLHVTVLLANAKVSTNIACAVDR